MVTNIDTLPETSLDHGSFRILDTKGFEAQREAYHSRHHTSQVGCGVWNLLSKFLRSMLVLPDANPLLLIGLNHE